MGQKMTWKEIKETFPDEWVAVVNYTSDEVGDVDGEVITHSTDKDAFYGELKSIVPKYHAVAVKYTGERIKNAEVPLLWQISRTA